MPQLWTFRLEQALRYAAEQHAGQVRKASQTPYIEHPLAVAMILDRAGFGEDVLIAALLHDVVEDTEATLEDVRSRFGDDIAAIVAGCSETKTDATGAKRPWIDRKRDHLTTLKNATLTTQAVILADKLHNLTCIALDLHEGRPVWSVFNAPRADILNYYRATIDTCTASDPRLRALAEALGELLVRVESME